MDKELVEEKPHPWAVLCGWAFDSEDLLSNHRQMCTGRKQGEPWGDADCQFKSDVKLKEAEGKPYSCENCLESFSDFDVYVIHMEKHKKELLFVCATCKTVFRKENDLNEHLLSGLKCTESENTDTRCRSRNERLAHTDSETNSLEKKRPFQCHQCEKAFPWRSKLDEHLRRHSGEKPFQCDQCDRAFLRKSDLNEHLKRHQWWETISM